MKIRSVRGWQVFDSRGNPTVAAEVRLEDGSAGVGAVPSGASTGSREARERRDGGRAYFGKGVSEAVGAVNGEIRQLLAGVDACDQRRVDELLIAADGTGDKSRLGANAMLAVSLAAADAAANALRVPLYRWLGGAQAAQLPCPMMNVLNGGRHADNNLDIQEFMLVPVGAEDFAEAMRMGAECYQALKAILTEEHRSTAVGDEGGFAPDLDGDVQALSLLMRAIERAGWKPGEEVALAVDCAASEWLDGDGYFLPKKGERRTWDELIGYYEALAGDFPLVSIEDPLGEEDFEGFRELTERLGEKLMVVGDDLFVTHAERLMLGAAEGAGNAILVKPNQVGTLTETLDAVRTARQVGYAVILSHRSGDTESAFLADLAVAVNADYIKSGAPCRSERLAKYNRLLRIEEDLEGS